MHISFTSTTTIPPPLPSILSLKHKAGWFPTSAHPSLTWQHWGAQRLQAASAPPPRGWWRAACLLPPSGHELFLGQQSVPRSSNLSPCTLSRRRLLQSRPQAHTEYQHFLCPFLQNFPPPPHPLLLLLLLLLKILRGIPGEDDEPDSLTKAFSEKKVGTCNA